MDARLFVYGTLKEERSLGAILAGVTEWRWLGPATIGGRLYDAGSYPALLLSHDPAERVAGHILEVRDAAAAFQALDEYEGVDEGLYARREVEEECSDRTRMT